MRITVLGGGHGSHAAAADLSRNGHQATLWRRNTAEASILAERPELTIVDTEVRDLGGTANVAFAETGTLPYLARKHGPDRVAITTRATHLPTGVFPPTKHNRLSQSFSAPTLVLMPWKMFFRLR